MKNLSRLLFALLVAFSFNANAQDENNPWRIGIETNAVDLYPVGEEAPLGDYFDEFFNANDHYNFLPAISRLSVSRYLSDGFSLTAAGSFNQITRVGDARISEVNYYSVDGLVSYSFADLINSEKLEPSLGVGGGYTWVDNIGAGTLNGALGLHYWFNDNLGVNVLTTYKHAFEDYLPKHWQHSAGISIRFGGKDTDEDGIYDKDDACPDVPGLEAFNGCPDSDSDGIEDAKDDCPNEAGLAEFNGCPDSDSDGVADKDDDCPTEAGLKALNGCPDADNDGIANKDDNCPNEAGPSANNGCPWPDTDGDGVLDKDDQCPDVAGTVANNGCPEVTEEVQKTLNEYARTINFDTGRSSIKDESAAVLADIVAILNEYPTAKFVVEGHTDSVGRESTNQKLSDARANAVKDYLVSNGIDQFRLSSKGYGESNPIASNKTRAGRAENRRVEINLVKE